METVIVWIGSFLASSALGGLRMADARHCRLQLGS